MNIIASYFFIVHFFILLLSLPGCQCQCGPLGLNPGPYEPGVTCTDLEEFLADTANGGIDALTVENVLKDVPKITASK